MAPNFKIMKAFNSRQRGSAPPQNIDTTIAETEAAANASDQDLEAGSFLTETERNNNVSTSNHGDNPYLDEYRAYVSPLMSQKSRY